LHYQDFVKKRKKGCMTTGGWKINY